jgi:LPS-assembly lipoprotein
MKRTLRLLLCTLCLPVAGCGFHPLYGEQDAAANAQLPDIFVDVIPGRPGQILRQALQQRLAGSSEAEPEGYTLRVSYALNSEAIAIHGDNTSSRNRVIGSANWVLASVAPSPVFLASGSASTVDGFNVINNQYFESNMASESTNGRVASNLAGAIATQLSIWFVAHPNGPANGDRPATAPPKPVIGPRHGFLGPQNVPGNNDQSPQEPVSPDGLPANAIGRTYQ